jgi:hypothetical protein
MRHATLALSVAVALLASPARAVGLGVDVGAGSWLLEGLQGDVHLRVYQPFLKVLSVAARPGVALTLNEPVSRVAVPLDLTARLTLAFFFVEAIGGVYWIPSSIEPWRAHAAGGLGFQIWKFQVGVEVGYLQPSLNVLARVGFTIF